MQVIATAGHAGHGKSALLRALTGMDPRRPEAGGASGAELGCAWLTLPSGQRLSFVDVPGDESLVPGMIAAVAPVPAVLFVVAADEGWTPQSARHLAVLDALGIRHGLLAVSRSDLADPGPALSEAAGLLAATGLGRVEAVAVSAVTGEGLPDLAGALSRLADRLPVPDPCAPLRVWVDRAFAVADAVVVTGTLPAGTVRLGDELVITPSMRPVRVQGIQAMGASAAELAGPARAALTLRGASHERLGRGMALVHPGRWTLADVIDVRLVTPGPPAAARSAGARRRRTVALHIGSMRTAARVRPLGDRIARLALREPVPLHIGDRVLLHDAATASVHGAVVLDVAPPARARRGAEAAAAAQLASWPARPAASNLLRRHGLLRASALLAMGISEQPEPVTGEWLADPGYWADLAGRLAEAVTVHAGREPLARGMPVEAARAALGLPDRRLVEALARPPLRVRDGLIQLTAVSECAVAPELPAAIAAAVRVLLDDLAAAPFGSPDAERLHQLGLDFGALGAAERAGLLLRISDQIVLAPGADALAARILAGLGQPFTAAEARQALGTTRRVAIPLLEFLDRAGVTHRLPDDRRMLLSTPPR